MDARSSESDVPWPFGSETSEDYVPPGPIIRSLDHRLQGYPKVAAFQDCDPSLLIFRKFGWLHTRVLLGLQDELAELEDKLTRYDEWEFAEGNFRNLYSQRSDMARQPSRRQEMIVKIKAKLAEYDELLLRVQKIQSIKRPSVGAQTTLFRLIKNTQCLVAVENEWIRHVPDLAALGQDAGHDWTNGFPTNFFNTISRRLTQAIFQNSEQAHQAGTEEIQLLTSNRMDTFIRMVLIIVSSGLLLAPVFILSELQPSHPSEVKRKSNYQVLTIFLFTVLFAALFSIFTRARRQEIIHATTAYAVLVILLGNTSGTSFMG
ncbi:MAG: hypothetical protein Q9164_005457 [Protoblastenia rupestris]